MKYCLENLKISEMVKDLDSKCGKKDPELTVENHYPLPHFYAKKIIYGYVFVLDCAYDPALKQLKRD